MHRAPLPETERSRLIELEKYQILDTLPETTFDDITKLAAHICATPIALISLIDSERQWFKAKAGIDASETPRDIAFCNHTILQRDIFEVHDALHDPRFADNPSVTENPFIRFYAGTPLVTHNGHALGTLCVIDRAPRKLMTAQRDALAALGRQVMNLLELHRRHIQMERTEATAEQSRLAQVKLSFAMDHSIDGMALLDRMGCYTYMNQAHAEMYGYEPTDLIGRPWTVLYTSEWQSIITTSYFPMLLEQGHWRGEVMGKKKSGERFSVGVSLALLPSHNEQSDWLLCTCQDITERKAIESKLALAHEKALSATKAKSEFLASMSHEIRTPMNSIIAVADLLKGTTLSAEQQEYVSWFSRAATSLLDLLNDILDLSKIEAGHFELESVPFDLHDLIDKTAELMAVRAHAKQLDLAVFIHPNTPAFVTGDPTRLRQVFVNLIGNAIKFTDRGDIAIRIVPDKTCQGRICCSVSDTGIGIPEDKLQTIFDSFTQVDSSTTRKYGGTGLGLSISKCIVELMGGQIHVESQLGIGTTFSFVIALPKSLDQPAVPSQRDIDLSGRRILVVDNSERHRYAIREYLSRLGAWVIESNNGTTALMELDRAECEGQTIDLIILDFNLPAINGLDLGQAIRARLHYTAVPLIMLVTNTIRNASRQAYALRISSFVYKPISRKRLLESLAFGLNLKSIVPAPVDHDESSVKFDTLRPLSILLVEDLEENRAVMKLYTKETPFQIETAENGQVAFEKFQSGTYDLVFMDMQMPIMDGIHATAAIRRWEREHHRKPTPIIALTGKAFREDLDKSLEAGCTAHLTKPIKKKVLFETILGFTDPAKRHETELLRCLPKTPQSGSEWNRTGRNSFPNGSSSENNSIVQIDIELKPLVPHFLAVRRKDIIDLRKALVQHDFHAAERIAHGMKGASDIYGFERIAALAATIEQAASRGSAASIESDLALLATYLDQLQVVFA